MFPTVPADIRSFLIVELPLILIAQRYSWRRDGCTEGHRYARGQDSRGIVIELLFSGITGIGRVGGRAVDTFGCDGVSPGLQGHCGIVVVHRDAIVEFRGVANIQIDLIVRLNRNITI